jgi:hypothetical protein
MKYARKKVRAPRSFSAPLLEALESRLLLSLIDYTNPVQWQVQDTSGYGQSRMVSPSLGPQHFWSRRPTTTALSVVKSVQAVVQAQPTISTLAAAPLPLNRAASGTVTAGAVSGNAVAVQFWIAPRGAAFVAKSVKSLGVGAKPKSGADWTLALPKGKLKSLSAGGCTIYARARNAGGIWSDLLSMDLNVI